MIQSIRPTERRYPLLYWTTFAYLVGVPNFVHFDVTGRVGNALNLTSISTIVLACIAGYLLTMFLIFDRRPLMARKVDVKLWLWVLLLIELLIGVALHPATRLTSPSTVGSLLSCFRLGQWVVAFCLVLALYSRTPAEQGTELVVRLLGRVSWTWMALVWTMLPIFPDQVYGSSDDPQQASVRRLGGQLLHPAHVAFLASVAFFYSLFFFPRGPRKWAACAFTVITLVLTGSRAQQAGFLLAILAYAFVLSRKPIFRWGALFTAIVAAPIGLLLSSGVIKFVGRGQGMKSLASLNDRTRIWQASFEAILQRPIVGYGYSVGARGAIHDHWRFAHWIPPHAHNEFIEIALDGGVIALAILVFLYGLVFWKSLRAARCGPMHLFVFLVFCQYCLNTLTGSEFSYQYLGTGGLLLLTFIGVLADSPFPRRMKLRSRSADPAFSFAASAPQPWLDSPSTQ
jgi:O-antigen ligase